MKQLFLYFFLSITLAIFAQSDTVGVVIHPNPFDSVTVHLIHINEGDKLSIELLNLLGHSVCSIPQKNYFESTRFSEKVDSISNGIFISFFKINDEQIIKKVIYTGNDSSLTLNYDIRIIPSKFQKEKLKIFPNPNITNKLTIETETESSKVQYSIFNMNGQLLYQKEVITDSKKATAKLLISDWESGQYIVKMKSDFGKDEATFIKISD